MRIEEDILEELSWRSAAANAIDALLDRHFEFDPDFFMRRQQAQQFIGEKLGVRLYWRFYRLVNERMEARGCPAIFYAGKACYRGVALKGSRPFKTRCHDGRRRFHHLRLVR